MPNPKWNMPIRLHSAVASGFFRQLDGDASRAGALLGSRSVITAAANCFAAAVEYILGAAVAVGVRVGGVGAGVGAGI